MKYYSTRSPQCTVTLDEAVILGLAPDGGLFMPEEIKKLPKDFFDHIEDFTPREIAFSVADALFGEDIPQSDLRRIVEETVAFPCPVVEVNKDIYALELFHGPTLAFKDFGARFMSRLLRYLIEKRGDGKNVNVLVATSGDTGSAVANGFVGVNGINVVILYPKDKVSKAQEAQFTTLGENITALEVEGTFDDCQRIVKEAFNNKQLKEEFFLTSANSINVARLFPQTFYYFLAYAQLKEKLAGMNWVVCVPSGNFGNLTAGVVAREMGLPISRFIAANNANNVVYEYLNSGVYSPRSSVETVANAMDVGNPSNFERLIDILKDHEGMKNLITGYWFSDSQIKKAINECLEQTCYLLDPHGACGYLALEADLKPGETGTFLETAHPTKFKETIEEATGKTFELHPRLKEFLKGTKNTLQIQPSLDALISLGVLK
ncbi:MAG: threonine synthase [Muribaculaceae bacterium]|nr:threonine synthase [Muribaculaceae bacterium]